MKSWKDVWYSNVARDSSWDLLQAHPYGAGLPEGVSTPRRIPWEYLGRVSCLPGVAVNPPAHSGDEFQTSPKEFSGGAGYLGARCTPEELNSLFTSCCPAFPAAGICGIKEPPAQAASPPVVI